MSYFNCTLTAQFDIAIMTNARIKNGSWQLYCTVMLSIRNQEDVQSSGN